MTFPSEPFDPALHRRMEARARQEFEAAESEAAVLAARRRRLVDAVWEAVHRGRRIVVSVGRRTVSGAPVYARNDLVTMETAAGIVDIYLPNIDALVVTDEAAEGRPADKDVETFAARVSMLQLSKFEVEVVCRGGGPGFNGTIDYAARDYVALKGAMGTVFVALEAIAYLIRRPPLR